MFGTFLDMVEAAIAVVTAAALAFCAIYVGVAVIGLIARANPPDEDLLISEAMVLVAFLPQIVLVRRNLHISVDLFVQMLPRMLRHAADILASTCGIVTYALLGWAAWYALDRALINESVYAGDLMLSEWPGRAMVVLGTAGGLLACMLDLARRLAGQRQKA